MPFVASSRDENQDTLPCKAKIPCVGNESCLPNKEQALDNLESVDFSWVTHTHTHTHTSIDERDESWTLMRNVTANHYNSSHYIALLFKAT